MLVYAIALAIIAAVVDHFFGIKEPWRKVIIVGIVILLIASIVLLIFPGILPIRAWP